MTHPVDTTTDAPVTVEIKAAKPRAPRITAPPFTVTTDANGDRFVELTHKPLIDTVRDAVRSLEGLYDKQPRVSVDDLFEEEIFEANEEEIASRHSPARFFCIIQRVSYLVQ